MTKDKQHKKQIPVPPVNISVHYYTDPVYSSDACYGFDDPETGQTDNPQNGTAADEPVESWGWVNNVD